MPLLLRDKSIRLLIVVTQMLAVQHLLLLIAVVVNVSHVGAEDNLVDGVVLALLGFPFRSSDVIV